MAESGADADGSAGFEHVYRAYFTVLRRYVAYALPDPSEADESNFTALRVGIGDSLLTNSVEAGLITEGWCRSDMSRGDPERWRIYGAYVDTGLTRYRMCVGKAGTCRSDFDQLDEDCNDDTNGDDLPAGRKYRFRSEVIKHDGRIYGRMWWGKPGGGYRLMRLQSRRDKGRYHVERSFGWKEPVAASETTASDRLMVGHYSGIRYRPELDRTGYVAASGDAIRRYEFPCLNYDRSTGACGGRGRYYRAKFGSGDDPFCVFGPIGRENDCNLGGYAGQ